MLLNISYAVAGADHWCLMLDTMQQEQIDVIDVVYTEK